MTEDQFQAELFQWTWNTFPQTRRLLFAVPNGGFRSPGQVKLLQATGVISGVADLIFFWKGRTYVFELKVGKNRMQAAQEEWRDLIVGHGVSHYLISEEHNGRAHFKAIVADIIK